jgi:hypothetical protein
MPRITPIVRSGPSWACVKSARTAATVGIVAIMPLIVAPKYGPTVVTNTTMPAPAAILAGRSEAVVERRGIGIASGRSRRDTSRIATVTAKAGARPTAEMGSMTPQVTTNEP